MGHDVARRAEKADGREVGGDDAQDHREPTHGAAGQEEVTRAFLPRGEEASQGRDAQEVGDQNGVVDRGEALHGESRRGTDCCTTRGPYG